MARSARGLYVDAVDALRRGTMAELVLARDWELLREVARMAEADAPTILAATDPALFTSWRSAVTRYHLGGWSRMVPERVDEVRNRHQGCATR
jgi:hypothetical protein